MKKIGDIIVKIILGIIYFIKFIVIDNFRGFIGLIGLGFILLGWIMTMFSFSIEGFMIFGAGLILEFIVWATGPIKITIKRRGK